MPGEQFCSVFSSRLGQAYARMTTALRTSHISNLKTVLHALHVFFIFRNCSSPVNDIKSPVLQLCGRRGHLTNFFLFISKSLIQISFQASTNLASLRATFQMTFLLLWTSSLLYWEF